MKAIVVVDENWGIGRSNDLLFSLPADMKHFRKRRGKSRRDGKQYVAFLSLGAKPLPKRVNIVLWPGGEKREDCLVFETLDEVFKEIAKYPADDVYVVGGAMMYATMLGYCSEVIVTKVAANGGAEVFFKNLDEMENFRIVSESEPLETNGYTIRFITYRNDRALPLPV